MPAQNAKPLDGFENYSHIFNKGVENRNLFNDEQDYKIFLEYLRDYLTTASDAESVKKVFTIKGRTYQGVPHQPKNYFNKVELIAYSLLPDHFHLLVKQITSGSLEKLLRSLSTRYAIYYNNKYQRHGSLFAGPYKTIKIKNASELIYLTRYFHREHFIEPNGNTNFNHEGYSSYEEYSGIRNTSWVKPEIIFSYLDKSQNDFYKGKNGYKNFVEKYNTNQKEDAMLESIIIERKDDYATGKVIVEETTETLVPTQVRVETVQEPRSKITGFIAISTIVYISLFTIGFGNIKISEIQNKDLTSAKPSPAPQIPGQVSGIETTQPVNPLPSPTPLVLEVDTAESTTPIASPSSQISGIEDEKPVPEKIVLIKISDGSQSVNIRKEPSIESETVGRAKDGDRFEFVSKDSGWYQIKLDDGSNAFIVEYAVQIESEDIN